MGGEKVMQPTSADDELEMHSSLKTFLVTVRFF
jgi:hypothetical protein